MRSRTTLVLEGMICFALCLGMLGCSASKKADLKAKKPPYVEIETAQKNRLVERLETTGEVIAINTVTLAATVEGPITFCPWREGDRIETPGQKLVEIARPLYQQELASAEAARAVAQAKLDDLKAGARPEEIRQAKEAVRKFDACTVFAQDDLQRIRALVASGTLPAEAEEKARVSFVTCQTQMESAKEALAILEAGPTKTELSVAQAMVEEALAKARLARAKLDECLLSAPFAGVITEVYVRPGDLATPRAHLLKIIDPASLVVRAGLPESSAAYLRLGGEATVRLDAYPGKTFSATITRIYPRLESDTRTRLIELTLKEPEPLLPRLFARVSVSGRIFEEAVTVPESALITTPRGESAVYILEDGKARLLKVRTGIEQEGRTQITEGLQAGQAVVTAGNLNLKNGLDVQRRPATPPQPQKGATEAKAAGGNAP